MTKTIMILVIAAALVAGTLTTVTIVNAQSDTIIACVNNKSQGKDLRIVDSAAECRNNESVLQWNADGPPGADGAKGDKGDTGADGAKGDTGDTGADGAKGDKGDTGADGAKGDTGDTGADGAKGDKGDPGTPGSITTGSTTTRTLSPGQVATMSSTCPQGDFAIGKDITSFAAGIDFQPFDLMSDKRFPNFPEVWDVFLRNTGTTTIITLTAICFSP